VSVAVTTPEDVRRFYGRPDDPVRIATQTEQKRRLDERDKELDIEEAWANLYVVAACAFVIGLFTYHLHYFVPWTVALYDATSAVVLVVLAFGVGQTAAPYVRNAILELRHATRVLAWEVGFMDHDRPAWLPPNPLPIRGRAVILPWHHWVNANSVITRRIRIARPVDWVFFYDKGHITAVGRVKTTVEDTPNRLAGLYGPRLGMNIGAFRRYTTGHRKAYTLELQSAWAMPGHVTPEDLGVVGPIGSHRYLEKEKK